MSVKNNLDSAIRAAVVLVLFYDESGEGYEYREI